MKDAPQHKMGIYLLPNLLTTIGLFAAFYAIVVAGKGLYENAAIAIFIAMIADAFDGRVARLTHTESAFGAEYDSLADIVSFGVAPALVAHSWSLTYLGKLGWLAAFFYTAAGALRLARFNTQSHVIDKKYFQGLPIPAAAATIASMVWFGSQWDVSGQSLSILMILLTTVVAILMVSNIRYYSFKTIDMKGKVPFFVIMLIITVFIAISIDPPSILLVCSLGYAVSGPLSMSFRLIKFSRNKRH